MSTPAPPAATSLESTSCRGLFRRRRIWFPTWRGGFALCALALVACWLLLRSAYPFLAVEAPIHDGVLVVEGWLSDRAMEEALAEFKRHPYERLYVTGGPLDQGSFLSEYKTYAQLGAASLRKMGLREDQVDAVPAPFAQQDRTYLSAVALKNWLHEHGRTHPRMHVISEGPHARRTRLLFEKAMGDGVIIGITGVPDANYDPKKWWKGSYGVRAIIDEAVAYGYARLLFRPKS